jgi:hypothetical protein
MLNRGLVARAGWRAIKKIKNFFISCQLRIWKIEVGGGLKRVPQDYYLVYEMASSLPVKPIPWHLAGMYTRLIL